MLSKIILRNPSVSLVTLVMTLGISAPAMALSFNWSFEAGLGSIPDTDIGQTITGTISGLVEGDNDGTGLTITVDSTPSGDLLGSGWTLDTAGSSDPAFVVTGGMVTFANAFYTRNSGTNVLLFGLNGTFDPALSDGVTVWTDIDGDTVFEGMIQDVPEGSMSSGLASLGLLGFGFQLKRKRHSAQNVS